MQANRTDKERNMENLEKAIAEIKQALPGMTLLEQEPMAAHCSFRIGGPARVLAVPQDVNSLAKICSILKDNGLAPFLLEHQDDAYVKALIDKNFQAFIDRSLLLYDVARYPVGVVGGFGWACRDILTPLGVQCYISKTDKTPIQLWQEQKN